MAYTADVNRWRGPVEEPPYRPHMLDSPWHPGWIAVTILGFLIWWPIGLALLFFTLGSRKMSLLESPGSLAEQDGADAVRRWSGCATTWSGAASASAASARPRAATAPSTNTAWKRCGVWKRNSRNSAISSSRLRHAKDKEEFDAFMAQHKQRPTPPNDQPPQS